MSNIKISGRLFEDPELRYTAQQKPVATLKIPMYTGGSKEAGYKKSYWITVTAWEDLATRVHDELRKGDVVTVTGFVCEPRVYKNKAGAEVNANLEITAKEIVQGDEFKEDAPVNDQYSGDGIPF